MILLALIVAAPPVAIDTCNSLNTQADMNLREAARGRRADIALNKSWKKLVTQYPDTKADFVSAQRLWLQFRDAECKARGNRYVGGSIQPMIASICYADLTKARTKDINMIVEDQH